MTDPRPRPQYGEYATPAEQAKAMGVTEAPPIPLPPRAEDRIAGAPPVGSVSVGPGPDAAGLPKLRRWDLLLTMALIGYATLTTFSQIAQGDVLSVALRQFYSAEGIGTYSAPALAGRLSSALSVIDIVLLVASLAIASRLLRAGRVAFWVPLLAGAVAVVVTMVFIGVLLAADPAFIAFVNSSRGS